MSKPKKLPDNAPFDQDNPEWTEEMFARAKPAHEVLSAEVLAAFPRTRGAQKAPKKKLVSMRFRPEVLDHFKAQGPGWQSRMEAVLLDHVTSTGRAVKAGSPSHLEAAIKAVRNRRGKGKAEDGPPDDAMEMVKVNVQFGPSPVQPGSRLKKR